MLLMALFVPFLLLTAINGDPTETSLLSNRVLGTLATVCGQIPYHTPLNTPYPTAEPASAWLAGQESVCLHDLTEVLQYCRRSYASAEHEDLVQQAIPNPFTLSMRNLPPYPPSLLTSVQVYLCLGSASPSPTALAANLAQSDPHQQTTSAPPSPHHLPSLIDVHRAYFEERFRQLANDTKSNVTQLIEQLRSESEGLAKLYQSDPKLAQYSASRLLQDAHRHLERIWSQEASAWSRLEQQRHDDLVKQLDSEDWAGENEFTYVLQEFTLDLDRVQDALSNLLNRLSDSVVEEVRHLRLVQSRQPWTLSSAHTNWTNHVTHEFTNIERVHEVLLKYVETATRAINTVRSLMIKNTHITGPLRPHITYKPAVLTSYNRLQAELFTAEATLAEAKQTLVGNVTDRMHALFHTLHQQHQNASDPTADQFVMDWLRSTHHSELAFIDLLVTRILDHSIPMDGGGYSVDSWWRPAQTSTPQTPTPPESTHIPAAFTLPSARPIVVIVVVGVVLLAGLLATLLVTTLVMLLTRRGRPHRFHTLVSTGTHRLKHFARRTGLFGTGQHRVPYTAPSAWKVERRVVVVTPAGDGNQLPVTTVAESPSADATAPTAHGFANPVYPSC